MMAAQNTSEDKEVADLDSHETTKPSECVELIPDGAIGDFLKPYLDKRDRCLKPSTDAKRDKYFQFLEERGKIYEEALETARRRNETRSGAEREENFGKIEDYLVGEVTKDFETYHPKELPDKIECWAATAGLVNIVVALVGRGQADDPTLLTGISKGLLAVAIAAENNDLKMVEALKDFAVADESFKSILPNFRLSDKEKPDLFDTKCCQPVYKLYPYNDLWLCPIEAAARLGYLNMVQELIRLREAKMEPSWEKTKKELSEKVTKKELGEAMMKRMLSETMMDEKQRYRQAFDWAVKMGHHEVVQFLIEKDYIVDLNQVSSVRGLLDDAHCKSYGCRQTPLAFAVLCDKPKVVKVLCEAKTGGLKPDVRREKEKSALQLALEVKRHKRRAMRDNAEYARKPRDKIERILMGRIEIDREVTRLTEERKVHVDAINAILVGTALIATATFAGWLSPPLGYSPGTHGLAFASVEGHPILEKFWVFNSLSFFFSIATFMVGANAARPPKEEDYIGEVVESLKSALRLAYILLTIAVAFVIGAFACAGFAVLPPIPKYTVNMAVTVGIGVTVVLLSWMSLWKKRFIQFGEYLKSEVWQGQNEGNDD